MKNEGILRKQKLIQEYYFKLKDLNAEKAILTKTINGLKERFENLIEVEPDLDQLFLFENMDNYLKESEKQVSCIKST